MAYKEVQDLNADTVVALGGTNKKTGKQNPKSAEGYYLGSREIADKKKKSGISYIHFLRTEKGNVGVWGKTDLDRKILSVPLGTMVKLTFDRMVATPNGEMYKYQVAYDDSNTIEVSPADLDTAASDDLDSAGVYEGEEEEETPQQRQAKINELLKTAKPRK